MPVAATEPTRLIRLSEAAAFLGLVAVLYSLMAIQPPDHDDFHIYKEVCNKGVLAYTWTAYQGWGGRLLGWYWMCLFAVNPFSIFKPAILITVVFIAGCAWKLLGKRPLTYKTCVAGFFVLGMPYAGHVLAWNVSAATYGISTIFGLGSFLLLEREARGRCPGWLGHALLAGCVIAASLGSEAWLFAELGFAAALTWHVLRRRSLVAPSSVFCLGLAALFSLAIFLGGGNFARLSSETGVTAVPRPTLSIAHLLYAGGLALKEAAVTLKDAAPLILLLLFLKPPLEREVRSSEPKRFLFEVLLGGAAALFMFLFAVEYVQLPFQWRTRFIYIFFIGLTAVYWPDFKTLEKLRASPVAARTALSIAVLLFGTNIYFAFVAPKFNLQAWLAYWARVRKNDTTVLHEKLPWGTQDDRYRLLYLPEEKQARFAVEKYWHP
jgi:hypothetical protein